MEASIVESAVTVESVNKLRRLTLDPTPDPSTFKQKLNSFNGCSAVLVGSSNREKAEGSFTPVPYHRPPRNAFRKLDLRFNCQYARQSANMQDLFVTVASS